MFISASLARAGGNSGILAKSHNQMISSSTAPGTCPQPRKTRSAPSQYSRMALPAGASAETGRELFQKSAKPMACKMCHGAKGQGNGQLAKSFKPRPRNFTCSPTMKDVSPGQMFWIIKNGSKGTQMIAHKKTLSDKQIWDLVKYILTEFAHKK
ncbi:MAG: c-type cytochrome [Nitrospinaceae bacterium]|nr:cytochrome c [Nitrospinaceae bacterium]NIR56608.1 cytochrome c [Nitrospinaceae bacterium]NIS87069.1 cytochrome c [Nitrospinaceae bacterium]NIT83923.1 cytochrome c [Nitrospinaceae bacterium]NIU46116.1 cytochrome c [Nitrospinaceae bacterium]